jgi:hypothetical protein
VPSCTCSGHRQGWLSTDRNESAALLLSGLERSLASSCLEASGSPVLVPGGPHKGGGVLPNNACDISGRQAILPHHIVSMSRLVLPHPLLPLQSDFIGPGGCYYKVKNDCRRATCSDGSACNAVRGCLGLGGKLEVGASREARLRAYRSYTAVHGNAVRREGVLPAGGKAGSSRAGRRWGGARGAQQCACVSAGRCELAPE